ncbi:Scr1 family TA system antitoxin-like transcriptional regulator [Streptomyces coeruleorubidus]
MHVPGLLQTEEYVRTVFVAVLPRLSHLEGEALRERYRVMAPTPARRSSS